MEIIAQIYLLYLPLLWSVIVLDLEIAITSLSFASLLLCKLVAMEIEQTYSGGWSWKNAKTSWKYLKSLDMKEEESRLWNWWHPPSNLGFVTRWTDCWERFQAWKSPQRYIEISMWRWHTDKSSDISNRLQEKRFEAQKDLAGGAIWGWMEGWNSSAAWGEAGNKFNPLSSSPASSPALSPTSSTPAASITLSSLSSPWPC